MKERLVQEAGSLKLSELHGEDGSELGVLLVGGGQVARGGVSQG